MKSIINFFKESFAELKKVTWPSRDDINASTKVVIISTIIIAVSLGAVDFILYNVFNVIFG